MLGALSFVCNGGGISIPGGNGFTSGIGFDGGLFTSTVATFIQVINAETGAGIGTPFTLVSGLVGPFFLTIDIGTISISITGIKEF